MARKKVKRSNPPKTKSDSQKKPVQTQSKLNEFSDEQKTRVAELLYDPKPEKYLNEKRTGMLLEESKIERNLRIILLFSIVGMILATYLTYSHYKPDSQSFCSINEKINCDTVNKSIYSELLGIPVAILGFLSYLTLAVSALLLLKRADLSKIHRCMTPQHIHWVIFLISVVGFGFSAYLSYIEWKVLEAWCPLCVVSFILLTLIMLLAIGDIEYAHRCRKKSASNKCELC
jgi:uncharacterized membrane protein